MRATTIHTDTTEQNLDLAIDRLEVDAADYSQRRVHGEITVRLRFVDGVAVQWGVCHEEIHKTGRDSLPNSGLTEARVRRS
ncbi:MAG: hypothetical protein JWP89_3657 [Schlesneria sp.]|nr:hypothetical protein [Schlesneria sp.]